MKHWISEGEYANVYDNNGKIVKISKDSFDEILTSEIREASFLKNIQFPFIPKIYSIRENNNKVEIEMENVGKSIRSIFSEKLKEVESGGAANSVRLKLCKSILPILIPKMLNILSILETRHIIHGDLSDGNITVSKDGDIHLIDWGAVIINTKNTSLERGCTIYCKAPELLDKGFFEKITSNITKLTTKSDIYAFGKVLMWMITGNLRECYRGKGYRFTRQEMNSIRAQKIKHLYELLNLMLINDPNKRPSATRLLKKYYPNTIGRIPAEPEIKTTNFPRVYQQPLDAIKYRTEDICWAFGLSYAFNTAYFYVKKAILDKNIGLYKIDVLISACVLLSDIMYNSVINSYEEFMEILMDADDTIEYDADDIKKCFKYIVVDVFNFDTSLPDIDDESSMVVLE